MVDDADLAVAAAAGDRDALAAIYDRYADRLHDLCWSLLRDRDEAADAVHDTFLIASTRLAQLRDPERLRPWLFSVARREALGRARRRSRVVPMGEELDMSRLADGGSDIEVGTGDAAALVWEAAEALEAHDRAVLDLSVRHGLEGRDLADALGTDGPQASVMLNRARGRLARAVGATLLARRHRGECGELDALLAGHRGPLDPLRRKRVARHADHCETCGIHRRSATEAAALLAAAPIVGAPAVLRRRLLDDLQLVSSSRPLGGGGWARDGFPKRERVAGRRAGIGLIAAAIVLLLGAVVIGVITHEGDRKLAALNPADTAVDPSTSSTAASSSTTTSTRRPPTTTRRPGLVVPPTTSSTTTTTTPAPTTTTLPRRIDARAGSSTLSTSGNSTCPPNTTPVIAVVTGGGGPPSAVTLHWTDPAGASGSRPMAASGNSWRATLGPFTQPGTARWWAVASGGNGASASSATASVTVERCS